MPSAATEPHFHGEVNVFRLPGRRLADSRNRRLLDGEIGQRQIARASPLPLAGMANQRARELRANQTNAERKLWRSLRLLKAGGFHFRRQVPIDSFIVDFACLSTI